MDAGTACLVIAKAEQAFARGFKGAKSPLEKKL